MFKPVDPKVSFPTLENEQIRYWKENKTFEKSVEMRPAEKRWNFLDGPPFVTGMPHYGSLISSLPKDLFGRYWTMKGYRVNRLWGWDGHGLPIENKVETALGIKSKKEIETKVGVKKFIEECRKYLDQTSAEWEWYVDHVGRWVDFKNAYKTWDRDYMESVMWVFSQMYEKGYVYKGLKNSLYCPHCATPISNFEVAMDVDNYKEVQDSATTYKYQLEGEENVYVLAWSTTPWNKIVTPALAINPEFKYVKVKQGDEYYILAKSTTKMLKNEPKWEKVDEFKGSDLVGKKYVPHYDYYPIAEGEKAFEIIPGDFVTSDEGTGVVTIAAYGEEDLKVMLAQNVHIELHLDEEGNVLPNVPKFAGMYYLKANKAVNEDLAARGLVYKDELLPHNVPLCWRCHTRLYNAAINAWYVNVQTLKPLMRETNEKVNWFPKHFKNGRFLKSLENAPDWNISRNRYWGSPVPVWECECGERFVPGSIAALEEASGSKISDLHKPEIDEVLVTCKKCGKKAKRTPEVLDSWIEAGSAAFAERHFPFNKSEKLEDFFPPDFIEEYTGQIRAWFYVQHVIGAALYKSPAFKNVSVTGVILGTDGRKMSKNYGNFPDPRKLIETYGGDALRLYLLGSPVMNGEDILISEDQYKMQVRGLLLILVNVYNFFATNANVDGWDQSKKTFDGYFDTENLNDFDRWMVSRLSGNIINLTLDLNKYDTVNAIGQAGIFVVHDLSRMYIQLIRDRVGVSAENGKDKNDAYSVLWFVLTEYTKALAPIIPFLSEALFKNLTEEDSVHLQNWPLMPDDMKDLRKKTPELEEFRKKVTDGDLEVLLDTDGFREVIEQILAERKKNEIRVRQPLLNAKIFNFKYYPKYKDLILKLEYLIKERANIKNLEFVEGEGVLKIELDTNVTSELKAEGEARDIVRKIQEERKTLGTSLDEKVDVEIESWPAEFEQEIKRKALVNTLTKADAFKVVRQNA